MIKIKETQEMAGSGLMPIQRTIEYSYLDHIEELKQWKSEAFEILKNINNQATKNSLYFNKIELDMKTLNKMENLISNG